MASRKEISVFDNYIYPRFIELMDGETLLITLKIIGNLLSGLDSEVIKIIEAGVLNKYKLLILNETTEEIKREVCWGVANIAAGNPIII